MAQRKIVWFLHLITKKFRRNIECSVQCLVESSKGYLPCKQRFLSGMALAFAKSFASLASRVVFFTRRTSHANGLKNIKKPQKGTPSRRVRVILRWVQKLMVPFPPLSNDTNTSQAFSLKSKLCINFCNFQPFVVWKLRPILLVLILKNIE